MTEPLEAPEAAWGGVYAMSLCTFALIASEFMPVSLLSPIAGTLHLSEGQAGQAISVSGLFAVLTSLTIAGVARGIDRRRLLLSLTALMMLSGAIVAFAPSYLVLMIGRALLGVVIGGFWSMSAATIMRLVPEAAVPRALAILNGGNAVATTVAAPLGSFMGGLIGWRGAFFCVVPVAAAAFLWQACTLPALRPLRRKGRHPSIVALMKLPAVRVGIAGVMLLFAGQFALFTYLRPFLEQITRVSLPLLSTLLLVIGVAGVLGTALIGRLLQSRFTATLALLPAIMAVVAAGLVLFGANKPAVGVLLAVWGLAGTAAPVGWWTWLSRTLPDDAEAGGGLMVAAIQLAITVGAATGGLAFDQAGPSVAFLTAGLVLLAGAAVALTAARHMPQQG